MHTTGITPFHMPFSDEELDDLQGRLVRARFTAASSSEPWAGGVDPAYLRDLVHDWATSYDWEAQLARLNSFPQFTAEIDGTRIHFVHLPAVRPEGSSAPLPLILLHGWPSSFVEMLPLAERLTDPARFDGDPAEAVDVVIPSLPGFLYSELPDGPLTRRRMAELFHSLMTDVLRYPRYGAFGGDIGGTVTAWLGALYPDSVVGIEMIHPPFPASFDEKPLSPAEQTFIDSEEAYDETDGGYSAIMITRPDTIAAALADSPAGLAAWIVDKYRDWSDCHGDLESRFDRDTLLTIITLYWVSESIGSSFRQYYDYDHNPPRSLITVPAAFTLSAEAGIRGFPREIAERSCSDIRRWTEPGIGGHFLPFEEPDLMARELREFFLSL